jgi:Zn-dependent protease
MIMEKSMMIGYIQGLIITAPAILLALSVHECGHAYIATRLGDPTAKMLGRVSLNPLRHLDPIGTIALFVTGMFGWARPVPVNPRHFKNPAKGMMLTSLAGPLANISLAAFFGIVLKLLEMWDGAVFEPAYRPIFLIVQASIIINVSLAVFNLIPIPPLDGSRVLGFFLPAGSSSLRTFSRIEPYGFIILLVLISSGVIGRLISPIVVVMTWLISGGVN